MIFILMANEWYVTYKHIYLFYCNDTVGKFFPEIAKDLDI